MTVRPRAGVLRAAPALLLVAACAGSGGAPETVENGPPSSPTTTIGTSADPTAPDDDGATPLPDADADAGADADPPAAPVMLTIEDFAEGWTASAASDDPDAGELSRRVADCLALPADAPSRGFGDRAAAGTSFEQVAAGLVIDQDVVLADGITDAVRAMDDLADAAAPDCTASAFDAYADEVLLDPATSELPPGAEIDPMVVEILEPGAESTDRIAIRTEVTLRVDGAEVLVVAETWYLRQGRALGRLSFQSFDGPFPADVVADVVGLASERLALVG